jgi:hypothetical protein
MNQAMLLSRPTIFGAAGGNLLGAGEAGTEVVSGADTLMTMMQRATGAEETQKLLKNICGLLSDSPQMVVNVRGGNQDPQTLAAMVSQEITRTLDRRRAIYA